MNFASVRPLFERLTTARGAVLFLVLWATWRCWGNASTAAFTRDVCVFARLDARPAREANTCFVTVGDEDLKKYPARDPLYLDRRTYARAIDRLTELGAAVVVVDVLFDRPTPEGPEPDAALAAAMARSKRVVLAHALTRDEGTGKVALLDPIPQLAAAARALGLVNVETDADGVMRHVKLLGRGPDGKALLTYSALSAAVLIAGRDPELKYEGPVVHLPTGPVLVPTDQNDAAVPDLTAVPQIPRITLTELLEPGPLAAVHRSLVAGKVAVIGSTSALLKDRHPFVRNWFSGNRTLMDGAWFIAAITENILAGTFVDGTDGSLGWPLALCLVILAALITSQNWRRGLASTLVTIVAVWLLALHAYTQHLLVDAALVSVSAFALWGGHGIVSQFLEKRRVNRLNRELSMEVQRVKGELEEASRLGRSQAEGAAPALLDKTFVARFLPERYTDLKHLGAGGMGVVFRGHDKETRQHVALKVLSPLVQDNPNAVKRFLIEGNTLQGLDHPGLVKVIDIQKDPLAYFAMELVVGNALDELVSEGKSLPLKKAVDIAIRVGEVLGYVHSKGLVHRDIKPSNIMVLPDGSVKLLDFGLVHDEGLTALTKTGDVLGTLKYMAPEQFAGGKVSPATDVYSLTVVLCQLIAGTVPPRLGHFHQPPQEFLATYPLPKPFVDVVRAAMEVDSEKRPVDGAELAKRLKEIRAFLDKTVGY